MAATALHASAFRTARTVRSSSAATVGLLGLVALLTLGAIGSLAVSVVWLPLASFAWGLVAWRGPRWLGRVELAAARIVVVATIGWAATMAGVLLWNQAGPDLLVAERAHAAYGEHHVRVLAGAPWAGIEGHGRGGAMDRIPFAMGIDAMLCNFATWSLLAWLLLRRATPAQLVAWLPVGAIAALLAGLGGGWRLVQLFD